MSPPKDRRKPTDQLESEAKDSREDIIRMGFQLDNLQEHQEEMKSDIKGLKHRTKGIVEMRATQLIEIDRLDDFAEKFHRGHDVLKGLIDELKDLQLICIRETPVGPTLSLRFIT